MPIVRKAGVLCRVYGKASVGPDAWHLQWLGRRPVQPKSSRRQNGQEESVMSWWQQLEGRLSWRDFIPNMGTWPAYIKLLAVQAWTGWLDIIRMTYLFPPRRPWSKQWKVVAIGSIGAEAIDVYKIKFLLICGHVKPFEHSDLPRKPILRSPCQAMRV